MKKFQFLMMFVLAGTVTLMSSSLLAKERTRGRWVGSCASAFGQPAERGLHGTRTYPPGPRFAPGHHPTKV